MEKILIVDDQEKSRLQVRCVLEEAGYKDIVEASSPEEALQKYTESRPDMVFLDIILPKMSGKELLKKLMEIDPKPKIVVMSVLSRAADIEEVNKLGAHGYFVKPFTPDKLRHIMFAMEHE